MYKMYFVGFFKVFFPLLCWVSVHCGIYKGSYNVSNISHLNSNPVPHSFIPPCSDSWKSFNRLHIFCIYIHVYILFAPYSSSWSFPQHMPLQPVQTPTLPTPQPILPSCTLIL
jgi:hypothetical protein